MNMLTSKPQNGAVTLKFLLELAEGDAEIVRNSRIETKDGKCYYSLRLIELKVQQKKELENATRNTSDCGRRSPEVHEGGQHPKGVGSLKLALRKFFSRLSGNKGLL